MRYESYTEKLQKENKASMFGTTASEHTLNAKQNSSPWNENNFQVNDDPFLAGFNSIDEEEREWRRPFVEKQPFKSEISSKPIMQPKNRFEAKKEDSFPTGFNQNDTYVTARRNFDTNKNGFYVGNIIAGNNSAKRIHQRDFEDSFLVGFNQDIDEPEGLQDQGIHKTILTETEPIKPNIALLPSSYTPEIVYTKKEKPNFKQNPNKRKGSEKRQPTGERERNVGHPDSEEHSRVAKGSGGRARGNIRRAEVDGEQIGKVVGGIAAAAGTGYLIYRGARLLPSLLPPLWWTILPNLATP